MAAWLFMFSMHRLDSAPDAAACRTQHSSRSSSSSNSILERSYFKQYVLKQSLLSNLIEALNKPKDAWPLPGLNALSVSLQDIEAL
jgi:hypothetical protein